MTRDAAPTPDEIVRSMPDASAEDLVEMAAEWGVTMTSEDVARLRQEQRARLFTASAAPPAAYDLDDDAPVDGDGGDGNDDDETLAAAAVEEDGDGEGDDDAAPALAEGPAADGAPANAVPDPGRRRRILVPTRASAAEPAPVKRRPGRPRKDGNGAPPARAPARAASAGTGAEEHAFRQAAIALVLTSGGKRARAILDDVLAKIRDAGRLPAGRARSPLRAARPGRHGGERDRRVDADLRAAPAALVLVHRIGRRAVGPAPHPLVRSRRLGPGRALVGRLVDRRDRGIRRRWRLATRWARPHPCFGAHLVDRARRGTRNEAPPRDRNGHGPGHPREVCLLGASAAHPLSCETSKPAPGCQGAFGTNETRDPSAAPPSSTDADATGRRGGDTC